MKANQVRQTLFPLLAALIWGTAFVAQSVSADYVQPFTFNAARSVIAFLVLLLASVLFRRLKLGEPETENPHYRRDLILGGLCCGSVLTAATNLQQLGLETTSSGKAGFITALYIVIVPLFGLFLHKKVPGTVWGGVILALAGLYFLCIKEAVSISPGDFYILLCAFCFSAQILLIDHFSGRVRGLELSCAQFLVVTVLSGGGMLAFETPTAAGLLHCLWPLLYVGIFSSGVAYTLQILAQKDSNPTVVSILLSLEAVFAALAGALLLHDKMSGREIFGCVLMLAAVVLTQLPAPGPKRAKSGAAV